MYFLGNKRQMLKDLLGHSPLINLFFKTITKKITVVQYQNEKRRRERRPIKTPPPYPPLNQKQIVAQQQSINLSPKSSLHSGTGDCPLEKLLLGVHEDVLVPCHDLHSLPDLPDERLGGRGHHRHGELRCLPTMVKLAMSPECTGSVLLLQPCLVLATPCVSRIARLSMVLGVSLLADHTLSWLPFSFGLLIPWVGTVEGPSSRQVMHWME